MLAYDNQDEGIIRWFVFVSNRNNECRTSLIAYSIDLNIKKLKMDEEKKI
jgi:hypothetical protein